MSEKEKSLAEIIGAAVPNMSEFDKGYFLAKAEAAMERRMSGENGEDEDAPLESIKSNAREVKG